MAINKKFQEAGKATRFGGERANPQAHAVKVKPWAWRRLQRRLEAQMRNEEEKSRG